MTFNRKETILDNLMSRTKAEINELRKLLDADVKSNLSKAEMAKQLAHYIRFEGEFWIRGFLDERFGYCINWPPCQKVPRLMPAGRVMLPFLR